MRSIAVILTMHPTTSRSSNLLSIRRNLGLLYSQPFWQDARFCPSALCSSMCVRSMCRPRRKQNQIPPQSSQTKEKDHFPRQHVPRCFRRVVCCLRRASQRGLAKCVVLQLCPVHHYTPTTASDQTPDPVRTIYTEQPVRDGVYLLISTPPVAPSICSVKS
jgi:hypothetical protein